MEEEEEEKEDLDKALFAIRHTQWRYDNIDLVLTFCINL
jgi:hypothetical protein